jgi:hypothetical protein
MAGSSNIPNATLSPMPHRTPPPRAPKFHWPAFGVFCATSGGGRGEWNKGRRSAGATHGRKHPWRIWCSSPEVNPRTTVNAIRYSQVYKKQACTCDFWHAPLTCSSSRPGCTLPAPQACSGRGCISKRMEAASVRAHERAQVGCGMAGSLACLGCAFGAIHQQSVGQTCMTRD